MARPPRDPSLLSWPWGSAPSGSGGPSSAVGLTSLPIVNSHAESAAMLEIIIHKYKFGLMIVGKLVFWLQEEVRKEDISIALMIREEFFTSVRFKDILEAISLILCYRTMW